MGKREIIEDLREELLAAIEKHNLKKAKESIELAKSIGVKEDVLDNVEFGEPPIHFAVEKNNMKILRLCLEKLLMLILHIAARDGKVEVGELLLKYKAYINPKNVRYQTPLHLASSHCQLDMVEFLLANKAKVDIQDWKNKTALNVVGDEVTCSSDIRKEISLMLKRASRVAYKVEVPKIGYMESSAVKPFSFINTICSWIGTSTTARSISALPSARQPITGEIDLCGIALLTDIMVRKLTGEKTFMATERFVFDKRRN